jgi:hypothetical protein
MTSQFCIQCPTLPGEILHLGREMRAIPAEAMDEQELRRPHSSDVERQLNAVTREFHRLPPYSPTVQIQTGARGLSMASRICGQQ